MYEHRKAKQEGSQTREVEGSWRTEVWRNGGNSGASSLIGSINMDKLKLLSSLLPNALSLFLLHDALWPCAFFLRLFLLPSLSLSLSWLLSRSSCIQHSLLVRLSLLSYKDLQVGQETTVSEMPAHRISTRLHLYHHHWIQTDDLPSDTHRLLCTLYVVLSCSRFSVERKRSVMNWDEDSCRHLTPIPCKWCVTAAFEYALARGEEFVRNQSPKGG